MFALQVQPDLGTALPNNIIYNINIITNVTQPKQGNTHALH